jgi:branched-subunit amino acid transport protein AzlD
MLVKVWRDKTLVCKDKNTFLPETSCRFLGRHTSSSLLSVLTTYTYKCTATTRQQLNIDLASLFISSLNTLEVRKDSW